MTAERARRAEKIAEKFAKQGDTQQANYWTVKAQEYRSQK